MGNSGKDKALGKASGAHRGAGLGNRRAQGRWGTGVRQSAGRAGVARTGELQAGGSAGERQARGARRRAAGARALAGARAHGRAAARRRRRRAAGRWARGRLTLGARGARGLGAWAGLGQCTRCTRPIFDPF